MKRLALLVLIAAACGAAVASENDWHLRIKKESDGWSAHFSGPTDYGSGRNRVKGSGVKVEKARALGAFSKLRIDGPFDVRLAQAGSDQATVVADDNIEPLVETVVEGDALIVRMRRNGCARCGRHWRRSRRCWSAGPRWRPWLAQKKERMPCKPC